MGVRGLQSYIERHCPTALRKVNIDALVREYKELHPGKEVTIVVDFNSWYFAWFTSEIVGALLGDNIHEIIYRIKHFVKAFKKLDVKLVFFMDGAIPDYKKTTWIKRRRFDLRKLINVFQHLRCEYLSNVEANHQLVGKNSLLIGDLLRNHLQCEVYKSTRECDDEIMEYVRKYDCCAVLCKDTDFVVSNIKALVISASTLNVYEMTACVYDKVELTQKLRIEVDELPLFATLVGNDIVPTFHLQNFHRQITNKHDYVSRYEAIGKYIGDHLRLEKNGVASNPSSIMEKIAKQVYGDGYEASKLDLIRKSYESYVKTDAMKNITTENEEWLAILEVAESRHRSLQNPDIIWQVMRSHTVYFGVNFEDYWTCHKDNQDPSWHPSYTVTRLLRMRLYDILLHECPRHYRWIIVAEWCAESSTSYIDPHNVRCNKIEQWKSHPGLLNLWIDQHENFTRNKWDLFLYCISSRITDWKIWRKLKPDVLLATASLYYLYEMRYLKRWEVLAFIGAIATFSRYGRPRICNVNSTLPKNLRSIFVYATFTVTFSIVYAVFAACGYPNREATKLNCHNLEGKLFHLKYQITNARVERQKWTIEEIKDLLCEDKKSNKIFDEMANIIFKRNFR